MINNVRLGCSYKIIPLVYDESLSYYEAIGKLREKINEVIQYTNDSLDQAIRDKLDQLFIDAMYSAEDENITLILGMN